MTNNASSSSEEMVVINFNRTRSFTAVSAVLTRHNVQGDRIYEISEHGTKHRHLLFPTQNTCTAIMGFTDLQAFPQDRMEGPTRSLPLINYLTIVAGRQDHPDGLPTVLYDNSSYNADISPRSKPTYYLGDSFKTEEELKKYCTSVATEENRFPLTNLHRLGEEFYQDVLERPPPDFRVPTLYQAAADPDWMPSGAPPKQNNLDFTTRAKLNKVINNDSEDEFEALCDNKGRQFAVMFTQFPKIEDPDDADAFIKAIKFHEIPKSQFTRQLADWFCLLFATAGRNIPTIIFNQSHFFGRNIPKTKSVFFIGVPFETYEDLENFATTINAKGRFDVRDLQPHRILLANSEIKPPKEVSMTKNPKGISLCDFSKMIIKAHENPWTVNQTKPTLQIESQKQAPQDPPPPPLPQKQAPQDPPPPPLPLFGKVGMNQTAQGHAQMGHLYRVPTDGNCGFWVILQGLQRMGKLPSDPPTMGNFRKSLRDYPSLHLQDFCGTSDQLLCTNYHETEPYGNFILGVSAQPPRKRKHGQDEVHDDGQANVPEGLQTLLDNIWSAGIVFDGDNVRVDQQYWMDANMVAPIAALQFRQTIVSYGFGGNTVLYLFDKNDGKVKVATYMHAWLYPPPLDSICIFQPTRNHFDLLVPTKTTMKEPADGTDTNGKSNGANTLNKTGDIDTKAAASNGKSTAKEPTDDEIKTTSQVSSNSKEPSFNSATATKQVTQSPIPDKNSEVETCKKPESETDNETATKQATQSPIPNNNSETAVDATTNTKSDGNDDSSKKGVSPNTVSSLSSSESKDTTKAPVEPKILFDKQEENK